MKAILYAAKSTEDKHGSIPTQLEQGRDKATSEGHEVEAEYSDEATSGWSDDRGPGLAAAMEHAERIAPCMIIVQHSDRLARGDARQARHLVEIVLWALKAEVTIRSVQDDFFDDPRIALTMGALMGQRNTEDSKRKSAAVKAGMKRRREAGKYHGGPAAYGTEYRDGEQVPIANKAPIVQRMFASYLGGRSQLAITRELIADGIPTAKGGQWHQGTVRAILAKPVYVKLGIIDTETWEKAEALRKARARTKGKGRGRTAHRHLFNRGMLRCGECGDAMVPRTNRNRRSEPYEVYYCYRHDKIGDCPMPPLRRAVIDAAVYGYFEKVGLDVAATRAQFAEARDHKLAEVRGLREGAEAEAQRAAERLARVRRDYQDGKLDADDWREQRAQLAEEHEAAKAEAARLVEQEREVEAWGELQDAEAETMRHLAELRQAIAGEVKGAEGIEAVRAALTRLFERFVVHHGKDLDHALTLMDERKIRNALGPLPISGKRASGAATWSVSTPAPNRHTAAPRAHDIPTRVPDDWPGRFGARLVIEPVVREAAIAGYEECQVPKLPSPEVCEEMMRFNGGRYGPIDWAEFERWRGASVEIEYETLKGPPILRREGLSQADSKYANGLTT